MKKLVKNLDLIGQNFDGSIVIEFNGFHKLNNRGYTIQCPKWKIKCICGNYYYANTYELRSGKRNRCGCNKRKNLLNERFGSLVVIDYLPSKLKDNRSSGVYWLCKCDCGKELECFAPLLYQGEKFSCGNRQCVINSYNYNNNKFIYSPKRYYDRLKRSAIKDKKDFIITLEDILIKLEEQKYLCCFTKQLLTFNVPCNISVDRINSEIGYYNNNIQITHTLINEMKRHYPQKKFIELCKLVSQNS